MAKSLKVNYEGKEYIWNDNYWYGSDFITPPGSIMPRLIGLIPEEERLALLKEIEESKRQNLITAHKEFLLSRILPHDGIRSTLRNHCTSAKVNTGSPTFTQFMESSMLLTLIQEAMVFRGVMILTLANMNCGQMGNIAPN